MIYCYSSIANDLAFMTVRHGTGKPTCTNPSPSFAPIMFSGALHYLTMARRRMGFRRMVFDSRPYISEVVKVSEDIDETVPLQFFN